MNTSLLYLLLGQAFCHTNPADYSRIPDDGKCRVLAMRGGGTKGAYEVGALKSMAEMLEPIDIAYDVLAGVSIGAINAAMFSTFKRGDEAQAIKEMNELWETYAVEDLWQPWAGFGWLALLWKPGMVDNTKMFDAIHNIMNGKQFQKMLNIISVDLNTGDVIIFDETTPIELQANSMIASASIPGVFPPEKSILEHSALADGGLFTQVQIDEPIIRCREAGYDDKDIIVDVIACFDIVATINPWTLTEAKYKNAYDIYNRKEQLEYYYYWYLEDILRIVKGFPDVDFRHLVLPEESLGGGYVPIFDGMDVNLDLIEKGEKDARNMLNAYFNNSQHHYYFDETDMEFYHGDYDQQNNTIPEVKSSLNKQYGFDLIRQMIADRE